jgi:dipeptidyl aminopeptidase/acylaminoacyl peptidase
MTWVHRFLFVFALLVAGCGRAEPVDGFRIPHPDSRGTNIEYFVAQPTGAGPWPTLVFLHGHQRAGRQIGGRAFVDWGVLDRYAARGYLAVSVSLPGYGGSGGPSDFAGPFTQNGVSAVIGKLVADQSAMPDKVLIQGTSLGAVTAALIGARDDRIAGLVLISGLYDLPTYFATATSSGALSVKASLNAQTGGGREALQARSVLLRATQIKAKTLILNGAKDDRTDPTQATILAATINAAGGQATVRIYPDVGHEIPIVLRQAEVDEFIHEVLGR